MTKEELEQLWTLLTKLKKERQSEYFDPTADTDFSDFDDEAWYEFDDGDNLIYGCDVVLAVVEDLR